MKTPPDPVLAARYRALACAALARPGCPFDAVPARVCVVDPFRQRVGLLLADELKWEAPISTAANGLGCEEGSYRTPVGWHRIAERIGAGARSGAIFRDRVDTNEVWDGEPREADLILTRVLPLEGLEAGVNEGPGRDSRERFIYLHGTNQESLLGQPVSHGCVRLGNADITAVFDLLLEGDAVLIAGRDLTDGLGLGRLHFAGVAGSGMSALAQFVAMKGGQASGSDRAFDGGRQTVSGGLLRKLGIDLHPQDGSGLGGDCAALVVSTAVEDTVPDVAAARRLGVPILHRSELLAHFVAAHRTVAVTGTSGKSTTTAMIFELLRGAGRDPSVITGGDLRALQGEGLWGNAWVGGSDLLVIEADESDGSVVRYHPAVGVVLNLQKDHKEEAEVFQMFEVFRRNTRESLVVGAAENLNELAAGAAAIDLKVSAPIHTAPPGPRPQDPPSTGGPPLLLRPHAEGVQTSADGSTFTVQGIDFELNVPGLHNVENALAALAACSALGLPLPELVAPLRTFQGVGRRFQVLGVAHGVTVVDDFGHNPTKIAASLRTAHLRADRVLAVFQPHGFGPLRFLRADLAAMFAAELGPADRLWLLEAHYAGGTAIRDISSADLVADLRDRGCPAAFAPDRAGLVLSLLAAARRGDLILVMGARDPSLTTLAMEILERLDAP